MSLNLRFFQVVKTNSAKFRHHQPAKVCRDPLEILDWQLSKKTIAYHFQTKCMVCKRFNCHWVLIAYCEGQKTSRLGTQLVSPRWNQCIELYTSQIFLSHGTSGQKLQNFKCKVHFCPFNWVLLELNQLFFKNKQSEGTMPGALATCEFENWHLMIFCWNCLPLQLFENPS